MTTWRAGVGVALVAVAAVALSAGCARHEPTSPAAAGSSDSTGSTGTGGAGAPGASASVGSGPASGPTEPLPGSLPPRATVAPRPSVGPPVALLDLTGDGLGVVSFGDAADVATAALSSLLGAPTDDSGWADDPVEGGRRRVVRWGELAAVLAAPDGEPPLVEDGPLDEEQPAAGGRLVGWRYGGRATGAGSAAARSTAQGVRLGLTAAEVQATVGRPLSSRRVDAGPAWCWPEATGEVCAVFDDDTPLDPSGRPDPGDRVALLLAGEA